MNIIVGEELPLIREALAQFCNAQPGCHVVAQYSTGAAVIDGIDRFQPDIAVLEFSFPDLDILDILNQLRCRKARTRVIILSTRTERRGVLAALRAGASAYILKSGPPEQLPDALRKVAHGSVYISPLFDAGKLFADAAPDRAAASVDPADPLETLSGRERQVFTMLVSGVRGKNIAAQLRLSPKTVDTYRASLMRKLDIHHLPGLVRLAIERENSPVSPRLNGSRH